MSASSLRPTPDKKAIASIRRLSCLGLGSQIAVPTILGELHVLIPSHSNQFFGPDPTKNSPIYMMKAGFTMKSRSSACVRRVHIRTVREAALYRQVTLMWKWYKVE